MRANLEQFREVSQKDIVFGGEKGTELKKPQAWMTVEGPLEEGTIWQRILTSNFVSLGSIFPKNN